MVRVIEKSQHHDATAWKLLPRIAKESFKKLPQRTRLRNKCWRLSRQSHGEQPVRTMGRAPEGAIHGKIFTPTAN
jgi:hypothetical protein